MPAVSPQHEPIEDDAYRVLITGFGPFASYQENPSWLAVKPLHDTSIFVDTPPSVPSSATTDDQMDVDDAYDCSGPRQIHITTAIVPVVYDAVLSIVPGFHARPPIIPLPDDSSVSYVPPPDNGYDLVFHVGVAGRGSLRMEKLAHKTGYNMKDASGALAPIVEKKESDHGGTRGSQEPADVDMNDRERLPGTTGENGPGLPPTRGFGKGYENFSDEELKTELPIDNLVTHLKEIGIDRVYSSMDAGHYLCDFIYYCSQAESRRTQLRYEGFKTTHSKVLFMHCPPVDVPLSTPEVTEAIQEIIKWVCLLPAPPPSSPPEVIIQTVSPAPAPGPVPP